MAVLQNFVDQVGPVVTASWLNQVDSFVNTLFNAATTPAGALTALGAPGLASTQTWSGANSFTGQLNVPTQSPGTNTTLAASTAFVQAALSSSGVASYNGRTGVVTATSSDVTGALGFTPAALASPTFTGVPAAPTAALATNTTQLATTAFVTAAIAAIPGGGVPQTFVNSIAALRTTAHATYQFVNVSGYYAAGDGGGGQYVYISSDTSSADNNGTIIVASDGGRWYYCGFTGTIPVRVFGAKLNGSTDDTTAWQKAIAWLTSLGGGTVSMAVGVSVISGTLTIGASGVSILGSGRGGLHDTGTTIVAPSILRWTGSSGGTMIAITPSGSQSLRGCSVDGVMLDGNSLLAAVGLAVTSCDESIHRISGTNFTTSIITYTSATGLGEYMDCQHNDIWVTGYQEGASSGAIFTCSGNASGGANFSLNRVHQIAGDHYNTAVILGDSDTNLFTQISLYRVTGSTAYGVRFKGSALNPDWGNCRWNTFIQMSPGVGGLYVEGTADTTYPSIGNNVLIYDNTNGAATPVLGAGATCWWGYENSPFGYRNMTVAGTNLNQTITCDGRMIYGGGVSVAAGGSTTVTYPTAFTSVYRATASALNTNATAVCINPQLSYAVISNPGGVSSTFLWSVEGLL